jgi:hypothetical protein
MSKRALAILAIIAGVLGTLTVQRWVLPSAIRRTADLAAVLQEIRRLNELITVRYRIQKVIGLEEKKIPVGAEKLLLIVQADVLAGVDLMSLDQNSVRKTGDAIAVKLPEPQILHVVIDEKNTRVWDRQVTWWTPWVPYNNDLERQARLAATESVRETSLEMGILDDARRNAERSIRELLRAMGIELLPSGS